MTKLTLQELTNVDYNSIYINNNLGNKQLI